jgi:hypothetical protein
MKWREARRGEERRPEPSRIEETADKRQQTARQGMTQALTTAILSAGLLGSPAGMRRFNTPHRSLKTSTMMACCVAIVVVQRLALAVSATFKPSSRDTSRDSASTRALAAAIDSTSIVLCACCATRGDRDAKSGETVACAHIHMHIHAHRGDRRTHKQQP